MREQSTSEFLVLSDPDCALDSAPGNILEASGSGTAWHYTLLYGTVRYCCPALCCPATHSCMESMPGPGAPRARMRALLLPQRAALPGCLPWDCDRVPNRVSNQSASLVAPLPLPPPSSAPQVYKYAMRRPFPEFNGSRPSIVGASIRWDDWPRLMPYYESPQSQMPAKSFLYNERNYCERSACFCCPGSRRQGRGAARTRRSKGLLCPSLCPCLSQAWRAFKGAFLPALLLV